MVADKEQTSTSQLRYVFRHSVKSHLTRMFTWRAARESTIVMAIGRIGPIPLRYRAKRETRGVAT